MSYKSQAPKFIPVGTSSTEGAERRRKLAAARAKAAKLAPEEPRHREESFLGEYPKWVATLVKCDDPFMKDYDEKLAQIDCAPLRDHFLGQRLSGVPLEEVIDLQPTYPPSDPVERKKYFDQIDYRQRCLNAFWARINGGARPNKDHGVSEQNETLDSSLLCETVDHETAKVKDEHPAPVEQVPDEDPLRDEPTEEAETAPKFDRAADAVEPKPFDQGSLVRSEGLIG